MNKRFLSLLLTVLLIFESALPAAAEASVPVRLEKFAFTTDDMIFREYTSTKDSYEVSMKAGERIVVPPLHWINTNYLSYDILSLASSAPEVVEVGSHLPKQGQYEMQADMTEGDRQNLGIVLYAKKAGTATVTVSFRTFLTKLGLNYTDRRGIDKFTKTFHITVSDASMKVSLKTTAAEDWFETQAQKGVNMTRKENGRGNGRSIKGVMVKMDKIIHKMAGELKMPVNKLNNILAWLALMEGASGFPIRELYEMYFDSSALISYYMKAAGSDISLKAADSAAEGLEGLGGLGSGFGTAMKNFGIKIASGVFKFLESKDPNSAYYETLEMMSLNIPRCDPPYVYLEVTMENDGAEPLENIRGTVVPNEHISFTSGSSGQGRETAFELPGITLAPGEKKTYGIRFFVDLTNVTMQKRKGTFDVECSYYAPNSGVKGTAGAQTSISINSMMTSDQIALYESQKNDPKHAGFYNKFYAVRESGYQRAYIACPVEVSVQDAAGNELAVVHTGDEEEYRNDGIVVGAYDDLKYVFLNPEFLDSYKVLIRAEEDGEMGVLTGREAEDTGMGVNLYGKIPLKKDEIFYLDFSENSAGTLYKENTPGTSEELEPTFALNEDSVMESLSESDISQWAVETVKGGILHGIIGDIMEESYQKEISLEEFCEMLLGIYEEAVGSIPGEKAAEFRQSYEDQDVNAAIGAAVSLGFLPEEDLEYVFDPDPGQRLISREDAALAIINCLALLGMDTTGLGEAEEAENTAESASEENVQDMSEAESDEPEETGGNETAEENSEISGTKGKERIEALRRLGIMRAEEGKPFPKHMLTREQSISALYEMWLYMHMLEERRELVSRSFLNVRDKLTTYDLSEVMQYAIQYRASEDLRQDSAVQTFSFYLPTIEEYYGVVEGASLLMEFSEVLVQDYIEALGHTEVPVPVDASRARIDSMKAFHFVADSYRESDSTLYLWTPIYFDDGSGGILDDTVYLLIAVLQNEADQELLEAHDAKCLGNYREEFMIIADQEIVKEYMEISRPEIERYEFSQDASSYTELARGSSGDDVISLQKMLSQLGYLDTNTYGNFGEMTESAVSAFQGAMGIEVTGVADPETQALLYSQSNPSQLLQDWLNSYK